jgi:glycosyltransferase involved in cell wall biosynthesis
VVHEAACCGCGIILSSAVGSRHDLLTEKNGWCFASGDSRQLAQVMGEALACSGSRLMEIEEESVRLSRDFGPQVWAQSLATICRVFSASSRL